MDISLALELIS